MINLSGHVTRTMRLANIYSVKDPCVKDALLSEEPHCSTAAFFCGFTNCLKPQCHSANATYTEEADIWKKLYAVWGNWLLAPSQLKSAPAVPLIGSHRVK